jgi:hypothetical protein
MDQRQHQADRESCEADRRTLVSRAENHEQEHECHHDFGDQRRTHRVFAR